MCVCVCSSNNKLISVYRRSPLENFSKSIKLGLNFEKLLGEGSIDLNRHLEWEGEASLCTQPQWETAQHIQSRKIKVVMSTFSFHFTLPYCACLLFLLFIQPHYLFPLVLRSMEWHFPFRLLPLHTL